MNDQIKTPSFPASGEVPGYTVLDLFSGIGGFSLGLARAGFRTTAFCEIEEYPRSILRKHWPDVPIFEDVRELHAWRIDENAAICYNEACALKNNKKLTLKNLPDTSGRRWHEELSSSALIAVKRCPSLLVSHRANIAPMSADTRTSAEGLPQIPGVESGCKEKETQIGRTESPPQEKKVTGNGKETKPNGEEEFLQETITLANHALSCPPSGASCERIILRNGLISPNSDLSCRMESLCAENVTTTCTCGRENDKITVVTAGFPCQPASVAGKRKGTGDDRWLWPEVIRIVREFHPEWCIFENVPGLLTLEQGVVFDQVLLDLEAEGYAAWPFIVPACAVNAPHRRDRVWIVAHHAGRTDRRHYPGEVQRQEPQLGKGIGVDVVSDTTRQLLDRGRDFRETGRNELADRCCFVADTDAKHGDIPGLRAIQIPQQQEAGIQQDFFANSSGTRCEKRDIPAITDQQGHGAGGSNADDVANTESQQTRGVFKPWFSANPESGSDLRGQAGEWITERPICGTHDGISERLDENINELHGTVTHGMMGKTSTGGTHYAEKDDTRPSPELRVLRERIEAKNIQWQDRGQDQIFESEILREAMLWIGDGEGGGEQDNTSPSGQESLKRFLRELRYKERPPCSSHRWQRGEQQEGEYRDIVFLLSLEMALEEWEDHTEKTVGVQNLWRACEEIGFMPKTLHEVQNSWRSMSHEDKEWCIICAGTGDRYHDCWPGVGGVSAEKISSRVARLKALGNAVVPQIPELLGRCIRAV
jgi:site-specific DNA-cytosine methylase